MTTEEKVDVLLNHMRLDCLLFEVREEKTNNVRKQDFEAAGISREKEKAIMSEIRESAIIIKELISNLPIPNTTHEGSNSVSNTK